MQTYWDIKHKLYPNGTQTLECEWPLTDICVFSIDLKKENWETKYDELVNQDHKFGIYFLIKNNTPAKSLIYIGQTRNGIKTRYKQHLQTKDEVKDCNILLGVYSKLDDWGLDGIAYFEKAYILKFRQLSSWEVLNRTKGDVNRYDNQRTKLTRYLPFIDAAFSYFQIMTIFDEQKSQHFAFEDFKPQIKKQIMKKEENIITSFQKQNITSYPQQVFIKQTDCQQQRIYGSLFNRRITIFKNTYYWTKLLNLKIHNLNYVLNIWRDLMTKQIIRIKTKTGLFLNANSDASLFLECFGIEFLQDWEGSFSATASVVIGKNCNGKSFWFTADNKNLLFLNLSKNSSETMIERNSFKKEDYDFSHQTNVSSEQTVFIQTIDNNKVNAILTINDQKQRITIPAGTSYKTRLYNLGMHNKLAVLKKWQNLLQQNIISSNTLNEYSNEEIFLNDFDVKFLQDWEGSISGTAAVIIGQSCNGKNYWLTANNRSLLDLDLSKNNFTAETNLIKTNTAKQSNDFIITDGIPLYLPRKKNNPTFQDSIKAFLQNNKCLLVKGTSFWTKVPNASQTYAQGIIKLWEKLERRKIIQIIFNDDWRQGYLRYTVFFQITFLENYIASVSTCANIILGNTNNGWETWKDEFGDFIQKYRKHAETVGSE